MKDGATQSSAQTTKFFEEFVRKQNTADFIKEYRSILGIPVDGIPIKDDDIKDFQDFPVERKNPERYRYENH
jgi:hypothetical protein